MSAPAAPPLIRRPRIAPPEPSGTAADRAAAGSGMPSLAEVVADHGLPPQGTPVDEAFVLALPGWPLAEWVDGKLDYLPLPSSHHQTVGSRIHNGMLRHLWEHLPEAALRFIGQPVRIPAYDGNERRSRYPDLALLLDENDARVAPDAWNGADLLVEIVSPDNPRRDAEDKRHDYAAAGVSEYWIADPRPRSLTISVLTLDGDAYDRTEYGAGETAESALLPGFAVDVAACLAG